MTVETFLKKRFAALARQDYEEVYETYHQDAPLRQNFRDAKAYASFASWQLEGLAVESWACLDTRSRDEGQVECLLMMELVVDQRKQSFYELALLIDIGMGWKYHSAQKLSAEDFSGAPDQIDFHHFDHASMKIRF